MTLEKALELLRRRPITYDRDKKLRGFCARTGVGYQEVLNALTPEERHALTERNP